MRIEWSKWVQTGCSSDHKTRKMRWTASLPCRLGSQGQDYLKELILLKNWCDRILAELFQILKDDAVKVLYSICQKIWKTQQGHMTGKGVFTPILKKGNAKKCSNYCTIAHISHASKVMLKIFQGRLQQYMNHELPDIQAGLRKSRGTRNHIANMHWITGNAREF